MLKKWLLFLVIPVALGQGFISSFSYSAAASANPPKTSEETSTERVLRLPNGDLETFTLVRYVNQNGDKEVAVKHEELRRFLPNSGSIVLYGRDLDRNGKFDAWFYRDDRGVMQSVDQEAFLDDGWDVASEILLNKVDVRNRAALGIFLTALFDNLTLSGEYDSHEAKTIHQLELNIIDASVRRARKLRAGAPQAEIDYLGSLISQNSEKISKRLESDSLLPSVGIAIADAGILVFGGSIIKGAGTLVGSVAAKFSEWVGADAVSEVLAKYAVAVRARSVELIGKAGQKVGIKAGTAEAMLEVAASEESEQLLKLPVEKQLDVTLRALSAREKMFRLLSKGAAKGIDAIVKTAKASKEQWKYIAITQSLQVGTEIYDKRKVLYDPNPIIMAKKIATNKDFLQDMAFMTNETFWTTGIVARMPGASYLKKILVCGIFSTMDSSVMNFAIRHESDNGRVALDTGWEVAYGNSQTVLDNYSIGLFESMALKNPGLKVKFLGYGVAVIDQASGYLLYGKATDKYESHKSQKDKEAAEKSQEALAEHHQQTVIVPVYGPS